MSENSRDTHFAKFAELLFDDLAWDDINIDMEKDGWEEKWKVKIAQRAYDLMLHVLQNVDPILLESAGGDEWLIAGIPDMAEWPEVDTRLERKVADHEQWRQDYGTARSKPEKMKEWRVREVKIVGADSTPIQQRSIFAATRKEAKSAYRAFFQEGRATTLFASVVKQESSIESLQS